MLEKRNKLNIAIGICLVLLGIIFIAQNYLLEKKQKVYDEMSFVLLEIPNNLDVEELEDPSENIPPVEEQQQPITEEIDDIEEPTKPAPNYDKTETMDNFALSRSYYVGKLVIPKINLAKGFTSQGSDQNTIEKNVAIMTPSDYPNVDKGNFILAAHAGNMWKSFFKNLYQLNVGDVAYVYYKNIKYTYKIVQIYTEQRGSMLRIYRDLDKTTMTLITCSKFDKTKQVIYILERD